MDVRLVRDGGVEERGVAELQKLLKAEDGFVRVNIPAGDEEAVHVLSEAFRFHPMAVKDAVERNRLPRCTYHDHVFVILHAPERGKHGHQRLTGGNVGDPEETGERPGSEIRRSSLPPGGSAEAPGAVPPKLAVALAIGTSSRTGEDPRLVVAPDGLGAADAGGPRMLGHQGFDSCGAS